MGPYQTDREASAEPMPREIAALHAAGRIRSGDPDRLARDTALRHLLDVCDAAGVELGDFDRRVLAWLVESESSTTQVIADLITRAHAAGRDAVSHG